MESNGEHFWNSIRDYGSVFRFVSLNDVDLKGIHMNCHTFFCIFNGVYVMHDENF